MEPVDFSDAALVLVAHGSTSNADSAAPARWHAAQLGARRRFAQVEAGFWKQAPPVAEVVESLTAPRVFIVPLMISEGYFAGQVIPEALGFKTGPSESWPEPQIRGERQWHYCRPVGTHPRMADLLVRQAGDVVARHPFPRAPRPAETALFLAGHGTERSSRSRTAVEEQADRVRDRGLYATVQTVYLEETPGIADVYRLTTASHVVVVPFFISDGLHAAEDIPILLGEPEAVVRERLQRGQSPWRNPTQRHGKRVWCAAGVGFDPLIGEIILDRVREAASSAFPPS